MAASTITMNEILAAMARVCGELYSGIVTTDTSDTSVACAGIAEASDDAYNGGIAWELGGSVFATISDYTGSTKTFTLASPGLVSIVAGDRLVWAWTADKYTQAFEAANAAVYESRDQWWRDVKQTRATATDITLASGDHSYDLPAACMRLMEIGIQPTTSNSAQWFELERAGATVVGQPGAFTLDFGPYSGAGMPAWSDQVQLAPRYGFESFADAWANEPLLLHYETWESAMTSGSGTVQLPLDYMMWVGAEKYIQGRLAGASANERAQLNMHLPQVQTEAAKARGRLKLIKGPREPRLNILG
jgi:hypothetical protein